MKNETINPILKEIIDVTEQNPALCYQCGKCSAGCSVRDFTDTPPNRIVRYIQLGMFEKALKSEMIWLCTGCMTCMSRCPKNFDLSLFMDSLREIAVKRKSRLKENNTIKFHRAFLDQIKRHGRTYEMGLVVNYKMRSGNLMQDVLSAPGLFLKGKISLFPHRINNRKQIQELFERCALTNQPAEGEKK